MREVAILLLLSFILKWKEKEERNHLVRFHQQDKNHPSFTVHRVNTMRYFRSSSDYQTTLWS